MDDGSNKGFLQEKKYFPDLEIYCLKRAELVAYKPWSYKAYHCQSLDLNDQLVGMKGEGCETTTQTSFWERIKFGII